jgi:DNA-binding MarR family transcriptional regulator
VPDPPPAHLISPAAPRAFAAEVRLSERILIQLAREGRLDFDAPATAGRTQRGLAIAVESSQGSVSKVLRRLVAAEVISEDRRHVEGGSQRMKVYDLTRRGEYLAREVAARQGVSLLPSRARSAPALARPPVVEVRRSGRSPPRPGDVPTPWFEEP